MESFDIFKTTQKGVYITDKKYFYNAKTHRLHIHGYCHHSKFLPYDVKFFDTYDEALAYDGRAVGLCKLCQKKENSIRKEKIIWV